MQEINTIKEKRATNFLFHSSRRSLIQSGLRIFFATENMTGSAGKTVAINSIFSLHANAELTNILNVTTCVCVRQSGARKNTLQFRRVGHTVSNCGTWKYFA